jgi:hypothetical protein
LFVLDPNGIKTQLQHPAYGYGSGVKGDVFPPAPAAAPRRCGHTPRRRRLHAVMARRSPYGTAFDDWTSELLAKRRMTQLDLTKAVGQHPAHTNQVLTGGRRPSPEYLDLVANALGLSDKERVALHSAAAKDHASKLDLTKK